MSQLGADGRRPRGCGWEPRVHSRVVPAQRLTPMRASFSYAWPVGADMFEVLCVPEGDGVRYLSTDDVAGLSEARLDRLRRAGRRNTAAAPILSVERRNRRAGEFLLLRGEAPFIGSKILDPATMTDGHLAELDPASAPLRPDDWLLVGAPAATVLLVHRPTDVRTLVGAIDAMARECRRQRDRNAGPISTDLYLWRGGRLHRITKIDPDTDSPTVSDPEMLQTVLSRLRQTPDDEATR
ncbi:MAG TPA: hypothetical protein PLF91_01675 [Mycolicibacterium fallax]|nr:hypothetical protein [Mycolicibacterium fallax]